MGQAGSFRANALDASQLSAAQTHEERLDQVAKLRVKRDMPPLVYSPYSPNDQGEVAPAPRPWGDDALNEILAMIAEKNVARHLSLKDAYEAHVANAKRNKSASKLCLHAFVQFPTDLEITPDNERLMLAQAVDFVNRHHGGRAVFHARIDRDEEGRHGVDVFYAPRYEKVTKRGKVKEEWVSLTKFGKALAIARFGQKPKEAKQKDKDTGKLVWKPVLDASGDPVMVDSDSAYYQGQALQDLFFEHLRDRMGLDWVQRGQKKIGREPDRLDVEEYKLQQDRKKIQQEFEEALKAAREFEAFKEKANEMALDLATQRREAEAAVKSAQEAATEANKSLAEAERIAAEERQKAEKAKTAFQAAQRERDAALEAAQKAREYQQKVRDEIAELEPKRAELRALKSEIQKERDLLSSLKEQAGKILADARASAEKIIQDAKTEARNVVEVILHHYEKLKDVPTAQKQLINNVVGLREVVRETLAELKMADQTPDLGERDEKGDPPPVLELIWRRAKRRTERKNELINVPNNTPGLGR